MFLDTIAKNLAEALRTCTCGTAQSALAEFDKWQADEQSRAYEIFLPGRGGRWVKIKYGTCFETEDGYLQITRRDDKRKSIMTYAPTYWRRRQT